MRYSNLNKNKFLRTNINKNLFFLVFVWKLADQLYKILKEREKKKKEKDKDVYIFEYKKCQLLNDYFTKNIHTCLSLSYAELAQR